MSVSLKIIKNKKLKYKIKVRLAPKCVDQDGQQF